MKKILSNTKRYKRGIALELTIFVMLLVFLLSTLLVSVNFSNKTTSQKINNNVVEKLQLDQIGESYISVVSNNQNLDAWQLSITNYKVSLATNSQLTLVDNNNNVKLSIKLVNYLSGYKVAEWKYS